MNSVYILELNSDCYFSIVIINGKLNMYTQVSGVFGQLPIFSNIEQISRLTEIQKKFNSSVISTELYQEITELVEEVENILNKDKSLEELYKHKYLTTLYPKLADKKILTLSKYLNLTPKKAQIEIEDTEDSYKIDNQEYYVFTNEEADEIVNEYANTKLMEVLKEIPKYLHDYFNSNLFLDDMYLEDRGVLITGKEEIYFNDFYIYEL